MFSPHLDGKVDYTIKSMINCVQFLHNPVREGTKEAGPGIIDAENITANFGPKIFGAGSSTILIDSTYFCNHLFKKTK